MRLAPLLAAGALVLHKLNGLAGGDALAGHGHSYLPLAAALVTVLLVLTCVRFARELWQASRGRVASCHPALVRHSVADRVCRPAVDLRAPGVDRGLDHARPPRDALARDSPTSAGWVPCSPSRWAALIALLVRGSRAAIELLARRHAARRTLRAERGRWTPAPPPVAPRLAVLAGNRAGRAPPAVSFS